jgi:hypothetical protein
MESMKNKVLVISAENYCREIEDKINEELEKGWLIELFYEARGDNGNKIIVTLYKEEENAEGDI